MKTGPRYKICKRLGAKVFGKCETTKFSISGDGAAKKGGRGGGGGGRRRGGSDYGAQLLEKQKARYTYGVTEKQFSNYVKAVRAAKAKLPQLALFQALEGRLDNVLYRMGLVRSRLFARQAVSHGHVEVNERRVTIPSYRVRLGDQIRVRKGSLDNGIFRERSEQSSSGHQTPPWLAVDVAKAEATVQGAPQAGQEADLDFTSIIQFYSRV